MPSFRTIFAVAATAFAALTSAAPLDSGSAVGQLGNTLPIAVVPSGTVEDINAGNGINVANVAHKRQVDAINAEEIIAQLGGDLDIGVIGILKRNELPSLCEVLVDVETKLTAVHNKLLAIVQAKVKVEVQVIVDLLVEVKVILAGAVLQVKAIVNQPVAFILSLGGKVLSLLDVCHIIVTVLSLICAILSCACRIVGAASLHIVYPVVTAVGVVLAELLCVIFTLVDGLYVTLHPFLQPTIAICAILKLDVVVEVLNGKF